MRGPIPGDGVALAGVSWMKAKKVQRLMYSTMPSRQGEASDRPDPVVIQKLLVDRPVFVRGNLE